MPLLKAETPRIDEKPLSRHAVDFRLRLRTPPLASTRDTLARFNSIDVLPKGSFQAAQICKSEPLATQKGAIKLSRRFNSA